MVNILWRTDRMAVKADGQGSRSWGRLAVVAGLGALLAAPPAGAAPVFLEYRCLLGGNDPGEGLFLGWEGNEVDRLLAPKPAGPGSERMAPRRLRLPLYTDTPQREAVQAGPVSRARGRDDGPRFTVGVGVGVTIGSALLYVQLGT